MARLRTLLAQILPPAYQLCILSGLLHELQAQELDRAIQLSLEEAEKAGIAPLTSPAPPTQQPQCTPHRSVVSPVRTQPTDARAAAAQFDDLADDAEEFHCGGTAPIDDDDDGPGPARAPGHAAASRVIDDSDDEPATADPPPPAAAPSPPNAAAAAPSDDNPSADPPPEDGYADLLATVCCQVCGSCEGDDESFVLCSSCDAGGAHLQCVGLAAVPEEDWFCDACRGAARGERAGTAAKATPKARESGIAQQRGYRHELRRRLLPELHSLIGLHTSGALLTSQSICNASPLSLSDSSLPYAACAQRAAPASARATPASSKGKKRPAVRAGAKQCHTRRAAHSAPHYHTPHTPSSLCCISDVPPPPS